MGFRVQLIAVTGKAPDAIHRDLGLAPTGRFQDLPEAPYVGANLPGGGYLLYINDPEAIAPDNGPFSRLSKGASLVACYANETVMDSYACAWVDGRERWRVLHLAGKGTDHVEASGDLPAEYPSIRDARLLSKSEGEDEVDYAFDVPVDLFAACGGIRYDQDIPGAGPDPWEVLERRPKRRWFGLF
ncbi:MAG: hypothetical protein U0800_13640 [Isosphaeraceae bacterium]